MAGWIPAFAGMTNWMGDGPVHDRKHELEHFPTKWIPVGRKKVLKANNLDRLSDSVGSENGLALTPRHNGVPSFRVKRNVPSGP